ncbi:FMN-binding negative transcriptional regulator [Pantoea sp. BS_4]|uniref:FMN-binding negative transcriptional regulator n=1 Tax=Pantoea stewartii TaxID=66269 RepID=A0AB34VKM6_9GAMM|nr:MULTISPECIES: FMN-binding negative transcriptional regulator [Pantoea]KTS27915.1 hypothetical protein NS381_11085 [Pantoea stewartii]KTS73831.1 hypothetical protein RSA30_09660 [Pantoea stewartii]KTT01249.1 hypothetical protein RSA13_02150 [Pantoea stewartii]KTT08768.1 hypothetical protein RSA36_07200 [Pantoea stewartii]MBC0853414.1 FMN-binding negative transcriptional regulator [Pantoea stewartii]
MLNVKDTSMTPEECRHFLTQHMFGTLVSSDLQISHIPFCFNGENVLETHLARNNPQRVALAQQPCLLSVLGPHAFISTDYYLASPAVPTWNYAAVSVKGISRLMTQAELGQSLDRMLAAFQPGLRQDKQRLPDDYQQKLMQGITGVRIEISHISGTLKLGQHRRPPEQLNVFQQLAAQGGAYADYARFAQDWLSRFRPDVLTRHHGA